MVGKVITTRHCIPMVVLKKTRPNIYNDNKYYQYVFERTLFSRSVSLVFRNVFGKPVVKDVALLVNSPTS